MKIVHIVLGLTYGGIETMLVNIVNAQAESKHRISLIIVNDLIEQELLEKIDKRVEIYPLCRKLGSKNPADLIRLNWLLLSTKPDIIHLHHVYLSKFVSSTLFRKRLCVTQHDVVHHAPKQAALLKKINCIFAISKSVQEDILRETGKNSLIVVNGIDAAAFKHAPAKNPQDKRCRLVQVSRLAHQKKGQHILLEALKILSDEGIDNIWLDFIGEGPSLDYLKELAIRFGLKNVSFLGAKGQKYIAEHLCEYDLAVQPSIYEGFGLTVAEAMAAKVPVLVSENEGPLEIIENGKYGLYFRNGSALDCASKIRRFLSHNIAEKEAMSVKAFQHVCDMYSVKATALNYIEKYREIISNNENSANK